MPHSPGEALPLSCLEGCALFTARNWAIHLRSVLGHSFALGTGPGTLRSVLGQVHCARYWDTLGTGPFILPVTWQAPCQAVPHSPETLLFSC